ncbi:WxL domain-containing protein [Enterococcus faecalis]
MKQANLFLSANLLAVAMMGAGEVSAQEYDGATNAKVDSTITFLVDDTPDTPVDPSDPDTPINPDDPNNPPNPNGGELMITYASNLNFGSQDKSEKSWNALADSVNGGTKIVPFIGTKDSRGSDRKGWVLTAKQDGAFKDSEGNELLGAELSLSNLVYAAREGAPQASTSKLTLSASAQEIARANGEQGIGSWSLGLGQLDNNGQTNGVTLSVPGTTAKNTTSYTTSVTWELTADPSAE